MADLQFIVDYSSLKKANQEIMKTGSNAQKSAKVFEQAYKKVETQQSRALTSVRQQIQLSQRMQRQKDKEAKEIARAAEMQEKATRANAQETRKLALQYNAAFRTATAFKTELGNLNNAHKRGAISVDQHQQQVMQLKNEYRAFLSGQGGPLNRFNQQASITGKQTNRMGVLFQQAGFQVGDFAVQVQSGANVLMAFGQQATQIIGTMAALSTSIKAIAAFSALGIIVPIATAIGGAFMRMRDNAKEAASTVDAFSNAVSSASTASEMHESSLVDLADKYGLLALEALKAGEEIARTARIRAVNSVNNTEIAAVEKLTYAFEALKEAQEDELFDAEVAVAEIERLTNALGLTEEQARSLSQAYEGFRGSENLQEAVDAGIDLRNALSLIPDDVLRTDNALSKAVESVNEAFLSMARLQRETEKVEDSAPGESWMNDAISGVQGVIDKLLEALGLSRQLDEETSDRPSQFKLRPKSAPSLVDDAAYAGSRPPGTRPIARGEIDLTKVPKTSSGGGGRSGPSLAEQREKALRAVQQLNATYEESVAKQLKVMDAQEKVNKALDLGAISADKARQIMEDYKESLQEVQNPMADFVNNSAKQMADAFTNIVSGAKSASDAFRDMARSIIEQAFRMAVVNPIINGIFGSASGFNPLPTFFPNANGNAFQNGRVTAFANGGVVNQPTVFPMASGAGLMGEAGPEAVMPLKRGKNGKLGVQSEGSQQSVVINQSFNFAANGDESVKRIIAGEAQNIANLTQKQIIDQRRRGGVMKNTFG